MSADDGPVSRNLIERERRRLEWRAEVAKLREHERRKQRMIQEYEKRARESKLRSLRRSRSTDRSRSPSRERNDYPNEPSTSINTLAASKQSIFRQPKPVEIAELRKIKVSIQRNIANGETSAELLRDIVDPGDIIVKRREGEGSTPLFDREELQLPKDDERRTIVTTEKERRAGQKSSEKCADGIQRNDNGDLSHGNSCCRECQHTLKQIKRQLDDVNEKFKNLIMSHSTENLQKIVMAPSLGMRPPMIAPMIGLPVMRPRVPRLFSFNSTST